MNFLENKTQNSLKNISNELIKFSLPLILSGILQQLYNWADAFIVGNVEGELALAAIGATVTVINFYLMAIMGFTIGLAIFVAQKFGGGETETIPKILATFSLLLGLAFVLLGAVGIGMASPMLRLLNTTQDTLHLAEDYLKIIFAGVPFVAIYHVYAAALRGIGDSRTPFYSILFSSVLNVVLDILFVALLHWGVIGAAVATVISQIAMTVFIIIYSIKKHSLLRFLLNKQYLNRNILIQGARLGIPPMVQSSIGACGSLFLQNFMNGFGTQTVAAITTAYRVDSIVLLPIINFGSGISTMVAQSYGKGEEKRAKKIFAVGIVLMAATSLLLTVLVIPTGGHFIAMFGVGQEATEIGWNFFRSIAYFYIVYGFATAARGYLEGMGDVLYSSMSGIVSLISRIVISYALASLCGNMIIAYAEAFSWGVLLAMYIIRIFVKQRCPKK